MPKETITIACGQIQPIYGDTAANVAKMIALTHEHYPDLMVFPELATSGYEIPTRDEAFALSLVVNARKGKTGLATTTGIREIADLVNCARETGSHLALGLPERDGERVYNSAILIEPSGKVTTYRKIHLFDREKHLFDPGNIPLTVIETAIGRVGLMICFDWVFPEVARTLALQGAQLLIHPANLVLQYCQKAMYARSVENGVFSVTCNRIGSEANTDRTLTFTGASQILSNRGMILAQASTDSEEVISATITPSLADNKMLTALNSLFDDRRVEFYTTITTQPQV